QPRQFVIAARFDQARDRALIADSVIKVPAPRRAALEDERRVKLVRTGIDPPPQRLPARLAKSGFEQRTVFQNPHVPAKIAEQLLDTLPQALANDGVEALPVVIDDPPAIAQALLPAFEYAFENVAFVEFGVANQRHHAALRPVETPAVGAHVILHERGKQRLRHTQTDRAGGEIDVVGILGARRIGLRAVIAAEIFELLPG